MEKPIILTFVGMPGAGKDSCTDYIAQKYNAPVIHFGHIVYKEVDRRGLDIVQHEKEVREDMRAKGGKAVLAIRVAEEARKLIGNGHKRIVLNGLYSWSEYKYLSDAFGSQFVCVAVAASRRLRYARILARNSTTDKHRQYTVAQIKAREEAEIEGLEKGGPIANADFTILNNSDIAGLHRGLDSLMEEVGFGV